MSNPKSRWRAILTLAVLLTSSLVAAAPAHADPSFPSTVNPGPMYWCTSTQAFCQSPLTNVGGTTSARMVCWWDDRGSRWFYVFLPNGQEGYVNSSLVNNQTSVPKCDTVNWLNVSNWAIARIGNTDATAADGVLPPAPYWWSGYCLTFAGDAWRPWGGIVAPTNANSYPNNIWDWYGVNNPGARHVGGRPPRGALVFWGTSPWHIAISLGNWQAVGTWGMPGQRYPVQTYNVNSGVQNYTGWIMPQTPTVPHNSW